MIQRKKKIYIRTFLSRLLIRIWWNYNHNVQILWYLQNRLPKFFSFITLSNEEELKYLTEQPIRFHFRIRKGENNSRSSTRILLFNNILINFHGVEKLQGLIKTQRFTSKRVYWTSIIYNLYFELNQIRDNFLW